jgi:hypothetical protein
MKVSDLDDEAALLHELKDIILEFIRQIKDANFSNDSDVKLLYERAKDIEARLVNVDYNGNLPNVNRLLEVMEKLEKKPDIIRKLPHFYTMFPVSNSTEAYKLYHMAFGAEKISEDVLSNGDIYIMMEINGSQLLLRPGGMPAQKCCVKLATEELCRVYEILTQEGEATLHRIGTGRLWLRF